MGVGGYCHVDTDVRTATTVKEWVDVYTKGELRMQTDRAPLLQDLQYERLGVRPSSPSGGVKGLLVRKPVLPDSPALVKQKRAFHRPLRFTLLSH
jgi:hypothetical protein